MVGTNDKIKGECPFAVVIIKGTASLSPQQLETLTAEIQEQVKTDVGNFSKLDGIVFAKALPKTRSGKIMRGVIKKILNQEQYKFPATVDDPTVLKDLEALAAQYFAMKKVKLAKM